MTLDDKKSLAIDIVNGKLDIYHDRFKKIYPFTTENIDGYLRHFSLKDKKLLTIGSSTDQAINASLNGCRDITILDICPFTKEHFHLKNSAIQTLPKEAFERFLFYKRYHFDLFENSKVLNKETFVKIAQSLQEQAPSSYEFWDFLLTLTKGEQLRRRLFSTDERPAKTIRRINPYLKDDASYLATRDALQETKVSFIEEDIMTAELQDKYDTILLSNLASLYSLDEMKVLVDRLIPHLGTDGKILVSYLYTLTRHLDYCTGEPEIYDVHKALDTFPKSTNLIRFSSIDGSYFSDGALIYQKKK